MKIIIDKVMARPPHAICRADVRLIMSSMPAAWAEEVDVVRLSASLVSKLALYNGTDKILTISSRGRTKKDTLHQMLAEVAAHAHGFKRRTFQHLQARYEPSVETFVAPLVDVLLPKLSPKTILLES
jgi:hypothetical protein